MRFDRIRPDAGDAMVRAVLETAGGHAGLEEHRGIGWASATFTGMRHALRVSFKGIEAVAAGERFAAELPRRDLTVIGHIVVDIAVAASTRRFAGEPFLMLEIEALTVEEA